MALQEWKAVDLAYLLQIGERILSMTGTEAFHLEETQQEGVECHHLQQVSIFLVHHDPKIAKKNEKESKLNRNTHIFEIT